jgi:ATP-dependent DNA ligase
MSLNIYAPMLVGKAPKNYEDMLKNTPIIGTVKIDGYWSQLVKDNNEVHLYSRTVSKKTGYYSDNIDKVPHIKDWAMNELPNGTCIIGEVYYPNGTSKNVTSVLGALPEKAIERQKGEYGKIHFYMHDILAYNGEDYVMNNMTYDYRYSNLCEHIDIATPLIPELEVARCYDNAYLDLNKVTIDKLAAGEEGMVFRVENGLYAPGKRQPKVMFKIKQAQNDIDFVITEVLPPEYLYTGKESETWGYKDKEGNLITKAAYYGWAGALRLGAYDNAGNLVSVGRVSSGLTDNLKADLAANPDKYIGTVVEVNCMSLDKGNKTMRHCYLSRLRADKPAQDCKLEENFS